MGLSTRFDCGEKSIFWMTCGERVSSGDGELTLIASRTQADTALPHGGRRVRM